MKPLILALCFPGLCFATQIEVRESRDALDVEVRFSPPRVTASSVSVEGAEPEGFPGFPSLPKASFFLSVPHGRLVVNDMKFDDEALHLAERLEPIQERARHCGPPVRKVARDESAYRLASHLPRLTLSPISFLGPQRVTLLTVSPFRFIDDKTLSFSETVKVRFRIVRAEEESKAPVNPDGIDEQSDRIFRSLVVNPSGTHPRRGSVDYIIAHSSYATAIQKLVAYKQEQGREVRLKLVDKIATTDVKKLITDQYAAANPPSHTLLVGSIDQIPSMRRSSYWSDYAYTHLDAGEYPDISIGRLPARNVAELDALVDKIISRETEPRENGKFLVTSGYETSWCQQNLKFIAEKIFAKSPIKIDITKLYASEGAKTDKVIEGYNSNPNVIIYDGHGDQEGMIEIPLNLTHLSQIKNKSFPIVFDIACLNSYWPSGGATSRNFAESLATMKSAGAAGILAASTNSSGHDLFRHLFRAFIYDEENASEPYHWLNEAGAMVLYGKTKYLKQYNGGSEALSDNYMFYYHGDPASTLFVRPL